MPETTAPRLHLPSRVPSSERARWTLYEQEKRRLRAMDLTPAEYDRAIQRLTDHLKL